MKIASNGSCPTVIKSACFTKGPRFSNRCALPARRVEFFTTQLARNAHSLAMAAPSKPTSPDETPALHERLIHLVDDWKRRLLDLTRRNKALNFKPTRVSTIAVIDEQPAPIFRRLVIQGLPMKFRALPEKAQSAAMASTGSSVDSDTQVSIDDEIDVEEIDGAGVDFVPYDATQLDERHTDDWLQTSSTPESLDKSLRRIDELSRSTIEEQGVNTLYLTLGMLYYRESADSEEIFKAPLVMVPAELTRKSARSGYMIQAAEDEPIANPALAEMLRRNFGIQLPELPPSDSYQEDYDLQSYLSDIAQRIAAQPTWAVKNDAFLASFSFQKLVMYKDLEKHQQPAAQHRLVRQLATREGSEVIGLPEDVRTMDLDAQFPPESTHQVVDADSSQLRAIAAVAQGHDLVVEGPPGTGKSQTITNLIATSLAAGKSVLFVAEKQAALSVVHSRLVAAGLGEFCLELHSNKANKRAVVQQIGQALDASLQSVSHSASAMERLPRIRADLTAYARALHAPFGSLGWSPFRVYGEFGRLLDAPRRVFSGAAETVTLSDFGEACRLLESFAAAAAGIGPAADHPWRDATKPAYLPTDLEEIEDQGLRVAQLIDDLVPRTATIATELGFSRLETFPAARQVAAVAQILARSPGAPRQVLESSAWNQPPAEALALVQEGRELAALREKVTKLLRDTALDREHADDIAFMLQKLGGAFSFLAVLNGRYRATKQRWIGYRAETNLHTLLELADDLKMADRLQRDQRTLAAKRETGESLFGPLWQGEGSDWNALDAYILWVIEFRQTCLRLHLNPTVAASLGVTRAPDVAHLLALDSAIQTAQSHVEHFVSMVGWPAGYFDQTPFSEIQARVRALVEHISKGPMWAGYENARRAAAGTVAADFVKAAVGGQLAPSDAARSFRRAFFAKWLGACLRERPLLERFQTLTHEERAAEFRRLDERVLHDNRARLVGQLRDTVQHKLKQPEVAAAMPVLRRELARQRGHQPLRKTLREAETAIRAIKPCFMMSPLTVAQFLAGEAPSFDVVIFDEASQLPSEDAAGAIIRGRQLVVVGDPKQLPPTTFFAGNQHTLSEESQSQVPDPESVLEEYMGAGMPMSRLKWHYRSAHESLINFSNVSFYDAQLCTFPSVETVSSRGGLQFEFVDTGLYEGKGLNPAEAKRVADAVVEFAKLQFLRRETGEQLQTLGVGTFNLRQQLAIQDELELRRRADPSLEPFFDRSGHEPFFVKNLENIQGDERDVIFISVTYAKGSDGKLRHHFGPLNGDNGWRRLNVLVTRARRQMRVFSSMRGDEINLAATNSGGARLLREFLLYAERGRLESAIESLGASADSPFEREVASELTLRGMKVTPQVGVAGYRIDLGITDEEIPGRFICGIECDGAAYHSSETARDRDRLRQQVLEARGWSIHRVWSTSWFLDRKNQIDRLCALVAQSRERLIHERDEERAARERATAEQARIKAEEEALAQKEAEEGRKLAHVPYQRMQAEPYVVTPFDPTVNRGALLEVPLSQLSSAVATVVDIEGPIHLTDLCFRVAQMWGTKAGAKIARRIESAASAAAGAGSVRRKGEFFWRPDQQCRLRSRAEVRTPADRIAPEEFQGIIRRILAAGHGFPRDELITEVRTILGFARTGAALDEAIRSAIDDLLRQNEVGEGSNGIKLRRRPNE